MEFLKQMSSIDWSRKNELMLVFAVILLQEFSLKSRILRGAFQNLIKMC